MMTPVANRTASVFGVLRRRLQSSPTIVRIFPANCLPIVMMLAVCLTACDAGVAGTGERVRLAITPVPTPTSTPPAMPTAAPVTYVVKAGDTLWDIANMFGVTVDDIVRANNIADPSSLAEGQVLTIPARSPTSSTPTMTPTAGIEQSPTAEGTAAVPTLPPDVTPPQGPDVPEPTVVPTAAP
jgi:LysM repeat protein